MKNFIDSSILQFTYYKSLGDKTLNQLNSEQLFSCPSPESNSVSIIVNHLHGNMLSRWTDFLTSDGEKKWRNRDLEFEDVITTSKDLKVKWEEGWQCLFQALQSIQPSDYDNLVYIRNQGHTITEAILRQVTHYAYHVGQIVYIGKQFKSDGWTSLSIPKGKSKNYNQEKFSKDKKKEHFTTEYLNKKKP